MTIHRVTRSYKRAGPCAIRADVLWTAGPFPRPAILWIHGGALISGDRRRFAAARKDQLERYVAAGFAVVNVDYRLAPETKLPDIIADVQDALRWTREKAAGIAGIDPGRVAAVGHSAGGYLALLLGATVTPRLRAVVSFYGYGDIRGDWCTRPDPFYGAEPRVALAEALAATGSRALSRTTKKQAARRHRFYLRCRQDGSWLREVAGSRIAEDAPALDRYCPARGVSRDFPPTMLLHGERDTDVPVEQSRLMAESLRKAGVDHELVVVPGGGHADDRIYDHDAVIGFLAHNDRKAVHERP